LSTGFIFLRYYFAKGYWRGVRSQNRRATKLRYAPSRRQDYWNIHCRLFVAYGVSSWLTILLCSFERILNISCVRDVVAIKNTARLLPISRHNDSFMHTGTYSITGTGPSQGMKDFPRTPPSLVALYQALQKSRMNAPRR
jgi:hypothetical protein